jgi:UDP-glucose 4-epimerase
MFALVTGISGRIGRNLSSGLISKGIKVRGLFLPGDKSIESYHRSGVDCIEGNLEDKKILSSILVGIDVVYHFGALLLDQASNEKIFEVNVKGTFNLLENIAENKIGLKRFVFASSDEIYPSLRPEYLPIDEKHPRVPYSFYGLSKLLGEELCSYYFREKNIPAVFARFPAIVGTGEIKNWFSVKEKLDSLQKTENPGSDILVQKKIFEDIYREKGDSLYLIVDDKGRSGKMPLCDVRDLVQGLLAFACVPSECRGPVSGEAFNFGPRDAFLFSDVVEYISKKTGLPVVKVRLDGFEPANFKINIGKARKYLEYAPSWDIYKMVDEAFGL